MSRPVGAVVGPGPVVLLAFALLVAVSLGLVARDLSVPGLYYDEVIQARQAAAFVRGDEEPVDVPGMTAVRVGDRWLPLRTQPYMGALKSQLLVPVLALLPDSAATLRVATLALGLLGVLLAMLWTARAVDLPTALVGGALLAVDPSLLYTARHDWGSFALGLALRGGALLALWSGWQRGSAARLAAGGLCLGLGLYNKIDFAVSVAAMGVALVLAAPDVVRSAARAPRRRGVAAAAAGFALGAAPVIAGAAGAWAAARAQTLATGDWSAKLHAAWTTLDGSYFHRLMQTGGRFEALAGAEGAAWSPLAWAFVAGLVACAALDRREPDARRRRARRFLAVAALASLAGIALTPRAVRIHHFLNALPFPHLVVAAAGTALWRRAGAGRRAVAARAALVAGLALVVAGGVRVDLAVARLVGETGGRGRWSDATGRLARTLPPGAPVISLDWGLDGPLRFLRPDLETREPFWQLRHLRRLPDRALRVPGSAGDLYLVWEPAYAVFPFGAQLLDALPRLPPGSARVRVHRDRTGAPVFRTVRFARDHDLVYRRGALEVRLR